MRATRRWSGADDRLVESDGDLAQVQVAIELAVSGEGSLVFVQGPAGIGKTGLLTAFMQRAVSAGFDVFAARCSELERDLTHGVVRQLFERRMLDVTTAVRDRVLAGPAALAADVIMSGDFATRTSPPATATSRLSTASIGWPRTSPPRDLRCSSSTMPTGPTRRRCVSSTIWPPACRVCRCSSSSRPVLTTRALTPRCFRRWPPARRARCSSRCSRRQARRR